MQPKKAVLIIAHTDYRDEELEIPQRLLRANGIHVTIASSSREPARGALGGSTAVDILIGDVNAQDFDAILFIGGNGSSEYWDDAHAHAVARDAMAAHKVLGAICIAPVTLARAGVLNGKRATVWHSEAPLLVAGGAHYTHAGVEVDGTLITADGPANAKAFATAVVRALLRSE